VPQRGTQAEAVSEARAGAFPLASPPPVFPLGLRKGRPDSAAKDWLVALPDPKLRLLAPGVYRITSHVVLETELSVEQLKELIVPTEGAKQLSPEEEERKEQMRARVAQLTEAYRAKLGEPPSNLVPALGTWLVEFGESAVRECIIATAAAIEARKLDTIDERYQFLRALLQQRRTDAKRKPAEKGR